MSSAPSRYGRERLADQAQRPGDQGWVPTRKIDQGVDNVWCSAAPREGGREVSEWAGSGRTDRHDRDPRDARPQQRRHVLERFVVQAREQQVKRPGETHLVERRREGDRRLAVVCAVQQQTAPAKRDPLEATRPRDALDPPAHSVSGKRRDEALPGEGSGARERHLEVGDLMSARQRERRVTGHVADSEPHTLALFAGPGAWSEGHVHHCPIRSQRQRRSGIGVRPYDRLHLGIPGAHDRGQAAQRGGLLCGDRGARLAEPPLVIGSDVGQDRHRRIHRVARVPAAAKASLHHSDVHLALGELQDRRAGQGLEVREVGKGTEARHQFREALARNRRAVGADALLHRDQVRRGVQPDPNAVGPEDAVEHRGGRALAVGAEDQDRREGPLRTPQGVECALHAVEAGKDPLLQARGEERLGAGR
jgi:hypothetical protein